MTLTRLSMMPLHSGRYGIEKRWTVEEVGRRLLQLLRAVGEVIDPEHCFSELPDRGTHADGVLGVGHENVADVRADVQHH